MGWDDYIEEEFDDEDDLTEEELAELTVTAPLPKELQLSIARRLTQWVNGQI